jgi:hypothetical protein
MIAVANNGLLQKRSINPLWTDEDSVVISASSEINENTVAINSREQLILTPTANLATGTRVTSLNDGQASIAVANKMQTKPTASTKK